MRDQRRGAEEENNGNTNTPLPWPLPNTNTNTRASSATRPGVNTKAVTRPRAQQNGRCDSFVVEGALPCRCVLMANVTTDATHPAQHRFILYSRAEVGLLPPSLGN